MSHPFFTEDHELFRDVVKQFVEKEVLPYADQWEEEQKIPKSFWKKMGEQGFLGVNFPEKYGGTDNDFLYSVVLLEELAKSGYAGVSAAQGVHQYMSTAHLLKIGSDFLKEKYLPKAIDGTWIGSLGVTEPGAGSDVANIKTTAVKKDGHYIINGQKTFITNGVFGDFICLACKTNPEAGLNGISLIMVDQDLPGIQRNQLHKMGWNSSDTAELFFDDVKVPVDHLVGEENQGFFYIMDCFQLERLVTGVSSVAGAEAGIDATLKYMSEREAFGRPLNKFQVLRHRMIDLYTELESVRQLGYFASWKHDQGMDSVKESCMVKLKATELAKEVSDVGLQCFGGNGYMHGYAIERMYRDARVGTIVGGTSEIMKEIIGKLWLDDVSYKPVYNKENNNESKTEKMSKTPETAREIIESLPERFKSEKAEGLDTVFHFDISGERGGQWTITLEDQKLDLKEGLHGEPKCVLKTKDSVYEDTELGRSNPQMAVMMGKIKISNIGEMMKFIPLFKRLS